MSVAKKKPPVLKAKQKEETNKKALVWIIAAFVLIVAIMTALIIWNP
ncbi:hypothetical protein [Paenibacillus humicola]|nr:hypothetical protein [Paenibacillus humicola]